MSKANSESFPTLIQRAFSGAFNGLRVRIMGIFGDEESGTPKTVAVDDDGHLQVDVLSGGGGGGGTEFDDGDVIDTTSQGTLLVGTTAIPGTGRVVRVDDDGAVHVSDGGNVITVDGAELAAIQAAAEIMDDWDESDRAKVNPIAGQAGVQGGSGTITALTQRVVLATDQPTVTTNQEATTVADFQIPPSQWVEGTALTSDVTWTDLINNSGSTDILAVTIYNTTDEPIEISFDDGGNIDAVIPPFSVYKEDFKSLGRKINDEIVIRRGDGATPTKGRVFCVVVT